MCSYAFCLLFEVKHAAVIRRENEFVLLAAISIAYQVARSHVGTALALLRRELRHSASAKQAAAYNAWINTRRQICDRTF
jgi:hypothetical protein